MGRRVRARHRLYRTARRHCPWPRLLGAVLLLCAATLAVLLVAGGGGAAGLGGSAGTTYRWNDGYGSESAWLAGDQLVAFLKPGANAATAAPRLARLANGEEPGPEPSSSPGAAQVLLSLQARSGTPAGHSLAVARGALLADRSVADVGYVFYQGAARPDHRLITTGELIVRFRVGIAASQRAALLARLGLQSLHPFAFAPRAYLVKASAPLAVFGAAQALRRSPLVAWAVPSWYRPRSERAIPTDPLFPQQWNFLNNGQQGGRPGVDLDLTPVWDTLRGQGEVIAIDDDGLQIAHPDLAPNVYPDSATTGSYDLVDSNRDPSPMLASENHGTACAGLAAAHGFDSIGITGAAPWASLIGYRFLSLEDNNAVANDALEAEVLGNAVNDASGNVVVDNRQVVDVESSSWGPVDDRHLEGPGPLALAALQNGVTSGRGGKGTVYVWASGNGRQANDNVNFDGYANSRYVLSVSAVTNKGKVASYSEDGAPIRVCAPGGDDGTGIVTTDRTGSDGYNTAAEPAGDYYAGFEGTSAAAPQVAGVVALLLQANPQLSWRDVQQILMSTARKNDPTNPGWTTNAAGYHINYSYGFGLVDAKAAVAAAQSWTPVGPEQSVGASATPNLPIPDDNTSGVSSTITLPLQDPAVRIEYVEVTFSAAHPRWSDLQVTLRAPSGTQSVLATSSSTDGGESPQGYQNWRFGSARDLGESSRGRWTLTVKDLRKGEVGTFTSWGITVYGTPQGPDTSPPVTRVLGDDRLWWNKTPTFHLAAVDLDSNVAATEYRLGLAPAGRFRDGRTVRVAVAKRRHADDGRHVVYYRSIDYAGNIETTRSFVVDIDTRPPSTFAPHAVRARRGGIAKLAYRVNDPGFSSRKATVAIRILDAAGRLRATIDLGSQRTGRGHLARFRCELPPGSYRFLVYATDTAGNHQTHLGSNRLLVS